MKNRVIAALIVLASWLAMPAMAQLSGSDYGMGGVRVQQGVKAGVVVDVVGSTVTGEASYAARAIGGGLGGAACAAITERWGSWAGRAAAMATCAAVGERAANALATDREAAQTFIVQVDGGETIAVTQRDPGIQRGQRVYVLTGQGTRIVKAGV